MTNFQPLQPELLRWCEGHAIAMAVIGPVIAAGSPFWLLSLCAATSFLVLLYRCRGRWTPGGRFGPGNGLTMLRLSGVLGLPWLAPREIFCWGLILLALDGVDGWIARRTGLAGEFGEFLDKESDAFFVLMLCLLLYRLPAGLGAWVLAPGMLRYAFVLFVKLARPPQRKERRCARGRAIFVGTMLALLASFAVYPGHPGVSGILTGSMAVVLLCSFAASVYELYRAPGAAEKT